MCFCFVPGMPMRRATSTFWRMMAVGLRVRLLSTSSDAACFLSFSASRACSRSPRNESSEEESEVARSHCLALNGASLSIMWRGSSKSAQHTACAGYGGNSSVSYATNVRCRSDGSPRREPCSTCASLPEDSVLLPLSARSSRSGGGLTDMPPLLHRAESAGASSCGRAAAAPRSTAQRIGPLLEVATLPGAGPGCTTASVSTAPHILYAASQTVKPPKVGAV
mmetsp:Transcript_20237/g.46702  ORF Transcript_20237/g.46702 Transcript_20237/m.46702 type:complete len:223 (-) Transcript_20237:92-760(-)